MPGGALDSHETPVGAAGREAHEEVGIDPGVLDVRAVFSDDHGNWGYHTVIAHCAVDPGASRANAESDEVRWVPLTEVATYPLHSGFAASWPEVHRRVLTTLES